MHKKILPGKQKARDLIPVNEVVIDTTPAKVTVGEPVRTVLSCPVETISFQEVVQVICIGNIPIPLVFTVPVVEVLSAPPVLLTVPTAQVCPVVSPILPVNDKVKHS